jgi:antitoxin HicB
LGIDGVGAWEIVYFLPVRRKKAETEGMLGYHVDIEPDDSETFLVTCSALPELTTFGETREAASRSASDAVEEALAARMSEGRDLPPLEKADDSRAAFAFLPVMTSLKVALYRALREEGLTRTDLQRRLRWPHREQVDRLLQLDHASRLQQLEAAFHALGRDLEISVKRSRAA